MVSGSKKERNRHKENIYTSGPGNSQGRSAPSEQRGRKPLPDVPSEVARGWWLWLWSSGASPPVCRATPRRSNEDEENYNSKC